MMKKFLITGISGQDGSYLTEYLLKKGHEVHGIVRRNSQEKYPNLEASINLSRKNKNKLFLHFGDLTDHASLTNIFYKSKPQYIINLAAQSHVKVSFDNPISTNDINSLGALRLLEIIKQNDKSIRYYQASTSELFGGLEKDFLDENTKFNPRSPYAIAKLAAFNSTKLYRNAFGIFACNGILFNHESPRRPISFVTRKVTNTLAKIKYGKADKLILGNLNATRDWGHAKDYMEVILKILDQNDPDDYVIGTGNVYTVKNLVNMASQILGFNLVWEGKGLNEKAYDKNGKVIVEVSEKYFRPLEVDYLKANFSKAHNKLNWKPQTSFEELIKEMVEFDVFLESNN